MEYKDRILKVRDLLKEADYVLIGAGAGLSTAAGMEYSGESFEKNYREFIDKYYKNANPQKLSYYRRLNCSLNKGYNWTK